MTKNDRSVLRHRLIKAARLLAQLAPGEGTRYVLAARMVNGSTVLQPVPGALDRTPGRFLTLSDRSKPEIIMVVVVDTKTADVREEWTTPSWSKMESVPGAADAWKSNLKHAFGMEMGAWSDVVKGIGKQGWRLAKKHRATIAAAAATAVLGPAGGVAVTAAFKALEAAKQGNPKAVQAIKQLVSAAETGDARAKVLLAVVKKEATAEKQERDHRDEDEDEDDDNADMMGARRRRRGRARGAVKARPRRPAPARDEDKDKDEDEDDDQDEAPRVGQWNPWPLH